MTDDLNDIALIVRTWDWKPHHRHSALLQSDERPSLFNPDSRTDEWPLGTVDADKIDYLVRDWRSQGKWLADLQAVKRICGGRDLWWRFQDPSDTTSEALPPSLRGGQSRIEEAIEESKALLDLRDNWDGEGALACSPQTWARAVSWLRVQNEAFLREAGCGIPVPSIDAVPDGSIDLHWQTDRFELLVNIPTEGHERAAFYGDDFGSLRIKGTLDTQDYCESLVRWLAPKV